MMVMMTIMVVVVMAMMMVVMMMMMMMMMTTMMMMMMMMMMIMVMMMMAMTTSIRPTRDSNTTKGQRLQRHSVYSETGRRGSHAAVTHTYTHMILTPKHIPGAYVHLFIQVRWLQECAWRPGSNGTPDVGFS